jgi:beta-lactamase regulating signal transducer with metallopeptidase domain
MILGDTIFNAFINANILFVVAYLLWRIARFILDRLGLKNAHTTQLKLLNTIFLLIVFSPFLILGITAIQNAVLGREVTSKLSDIVVSYYLNGGFEMRAMEFERLLSLRSTITTDILGAGSWFSWAVIATFCVGLIYGTARLILSMYCLRNIVSASYAWRNFGRLRIRLSDRTMVPFSTRGLRNYYIVLPSHMLGSADELNVSLAHEFQHLRQGDIEWEVMLEVLKPLFFLNPAYHAWKRQVEILRELACDSQVITRGLVEVNAYCDTLLSVCQKTLRRDRAFVLAVPKVTLVTTDHYTLFDGKMSFLEQRIITLLDAQRLSYPKLVYTAMILPLMAAIILTALAIQKPSDWSQDRLMLSTVVNLERLEEINRISTFSRLRN